jgi:hypothetical protein
MPATSFLLAISAGHCFIASFSQLQVAHVAQEPAFVLYVNHAQ